MAAPVITTIDPVSGPIGEVIPFHIVGTDLGSAAVTGPAGVTIAVSSNTATDIIGTITLDSALALGTFQITVTTAGGSTQTDFVALAAVPTNPTGFVMTKGGIDPTVGSVDFTDPTHIVTAQGMGYVDLTHGQQSTYLFCTIAHVQVPDGYTVIGVKVIVDLNASVANTMHLASIKLIKGSVLTGNEKTQFNDGTGFMPTAPALKEAGAYNDMWGATLTPADVRADGFGVAISFKNDHASAKARLNVFGTRGVTIQVFAQATGQGNTNWTGVSVNAATRRGGR